MPWILGGGGGLVVIGIVVVLIMTLGGGSSPRAVAQKAVDIMSSGNYPELADVWCAKEKGEIPGRNYNPVRQLSQLPSIPDNLRQVLQNGKLSFALKSLTQDSDSHATAMLTEALTNVPSDLPPGLRELTRPRDIPPLDVIKENGDWKMCGFDKPGR